MTDLESCRLCEWRCGANRLRGERGVCRTGQAEVAATMCSGSLSSYIVTLLGCCYRCLHCNAYRISQHPDPSWHYAGYVPPVALVADARERVAAFKGPRIHTIGFTGRDPIIHLPYIEEVAAEVRRQGLDLGIGLSTGGFATPEAMSRIVDLCRVITLEIKAWSDPVHRALTGAPVAPVLRNAEYLVREGRERIRVFRTVVIPGMTDGEVAAIAGFIASLDPTVPYRLIGFRPNNVLYYHSGPSRAEMERLCAVCRDAGLEDVAWSGYYPEEVPDEVASEATRLIAAYGGEPAAALTAAYAAVCGCPTHPRNWGMPPPRPLSCYAQGALAGAVKPVPAGRTPGRNGAYVHCPEGRISRMISCPPLACFLHKPRHPCGNPNILPGGLLRNRGLDVDHRAAVDGVEASPHRNAVLAGDEEGFLYRIADDPNRLQVHSAGVG